jgi:hypothetical protein
LSAINDFASGSIVRLAGTASVRQKYLQKLTESLQCRER